MNRYFGLILGKERQSVVQLENEWCKITFEEDLLEYCKEKANNEVNRFIKVPIGLARETVYLKELKHNPKIQYLQNNLDTCVFASLASAVHYMNFHDLALKIKEYEQYYIDHKFEMKYEKIMSILNDKIGYMNEKLFYKQYHLKKIHNPENVDIIEEGKNNPSTLYHVVIKGDDLSQNHCISIYNNWIFDGNIYNTMNLEKKYLNLSVNCNYIGSVSGYKYEQNSIYKPSKRFNYKKKYR
jgi:hypothetical protein